MLIFRLWNWIKGYMVIHVNTTNYEKIISILRRKNINLWDVKKHETGISFKISYDEYRKNDKLFSDINLKPNRKIGVSFSLNKIKLRKGFIIGFLILIICFFVFTFLVWNIEVIGTDQVMSKNIILTLKENNIKIPLKSNNLNKKYVETIIYKNFDRFKFVEAYIEGSKLIIFVKEKKVENLEIKANTPSSIISSKDAIINKIIAKSGQPVVRVGDVVYKGQTLVMGIIPSRDSDEVIMVPSSGIVYGKTYYSFELKEPKLKNITILTNNEKEIYYLKINDKTIKMIGREKPFKQYSYKEDIKKIPIISNITNISLIKGIYYEEKDSELKISENTAKNKMKVKMYDELLKNCNMNSKTFNTSLHFSQDDNYYYLNAQIELIEDIGEYVKLFPIKNNDKIKEPEED